MPLQFIIIVIDLVFGLPYIAFHCFCQFLQRIILAAGGFFFGCCSSDSVVYGKSQPLTATIS